MKYRPTLAQTDELLPMQSDHFAHNKRKNTIFRVLQGSAGTLARRDGQCKFIWDEVCQVLSKSDDVW